MLTLFGAGLGVVASGAIALSAILAGAGYVVPAAILALGVVLVVAMTIEITIMIEDTNAEDVGN